MNKRYYPLLLIGATVVFLTACSGEKTSNEASEPSRESPTTETLTEEPEPVENQEEAAESSDWQINNYAEFLLGESIAASAEDFDGNNGVGWYFQTLDVNGGYASITGAVEGWKEFVVWRMADGNDLVGEMTVGCGPACDYSFHFYTGLGSDIAEMDMGDIIPMDQLIEHKEKMVPEIVAEYPVDYPEDSQLVFNFPQKGTAMQVDVVVGADEIRVPIAILGWDKSIFFVEELKEDIEIVAG